MVTRGHTFYSYKTNYVFSEKNYSVRHHICDSPASLCNPPKIPSVQCLFQSWKLKIRVSLNNLSFDIR